MPVHGTSRATANRPYPRIALACLACAMAHAWGVSAPRPAHAAPPAEYEWEQVTLNAPFKARDGAGAITYRGRMWLRHGLRPRAEVRVVRGLVPSRITGRLVGMPEGARLAVCAHVLWNLDISGRLEPDGRFEIWGVPPGSWRIEAYPTHAGWDYRGEAEASAGAHVEIRR